MVVVPERIKRGKKVFVFKYVDEEGRAWYENITNNRSYWRSKKCMQ
jgi:hypothetical protein